MLQLKITRIIARSWIKIRLNIILNSIVFCRLNPIRIFNANKKSVLNFYSIILQKKNCSEMLLEVNEQFTFKIFVVLKISLFLFFLFPMFLLKSLFLVQVKTIFAFFDRWKEEPFQLCLNWRLSLPIIPKRIQFKM